MADSSVGSKRVRVLISREDPWRAFDVSADTTIGDMEDLVVKFQRIPKEEQVYYVGNNKTLVEDDTAVGSLASAFPAHL